MAESRSAATSPDLPPRANLILFALWLLVFTSGSQVMLISPIFPRIREQLGMAESALGSLVAIDAVLLGAVALIAGPISDRIGRRRILLVGSGLMAVALACHALAFDYYSLLTVRALAGAAGGVLSGAAVAYIGDYFPYRQRGWANGWVLTGMAFGHIVGIPAGTLLAASFGFRIPYLAFGAVAAATFLLVWRAVPQPDGVRSAERLSVRGAVRNYASLLRDVAIAAAVVTFAISFLGNSLFLIYLPTWLEDALGATPAQVAALFLVGGLANVMAGPHAGRLSDRIGRKRLIVVSTAGVGLLMPVMTLLVHTPFGALPLFFLIMVLFAARMGPFQALLTQLVPAQRRGSLMSLTVGVGQLGFATGSTLAGWMYAHRGFPASSALASAFVLLTAAIVWRLLPEPADDVPIPDVAAVPDRLKIS